MGGVEPCGRGTATWSIVRTCAVRGMLACDGGFFMRALSAAMAARGALSAVVGAISAAAIADVGRATVVTLIL